MYVCVLYCIYNHMAVASGPAGPVLAGPVLRRISQLRMRGTLNQGRFISFTPALFVQPRLLALRLKRLQLAILATVHKRIHPPQLTNHVIKHDVTKGGGV